LEQVFSPDALERLTRSGQDYYSTHGHYVPGLAALASHYLAENETLRAAMERMNGLLFAAQQDANSGKTASAQFIDKCVNEALAIGREEFAAARGGDAA
jgi:hypothetical protein